MKKCIILLIRCIVIISMLTLLPGISYSTGADLDYYNPGEYPVLVQNVPGSVAPVELDIYVPMKPERRYPVVVFQHGFTASIKAYETILTHLASCGFVVVAPQMYPPGDFMSGPSPEDEAALGVQIITWLEENINSVLPKHVYADMSLLGLSGHSRGGQIAYRIALQITEKVKALAGVDPVDGLEMFGQTLVITGPLTFHIPCYVLGTGLGPVPPPDTEFDLSCAPEEVGHNHFYQGSPDPSWHVVATINGHADMIDEDDYVEFCPGGPDRDGMRSLTGGTLAAFFSGVLQGNYQALFVLIDPSTTPVPVEMEMKAEIADCSTLVDVFAMYQTFVNSQANGRDVFSCYQEYRSHK
ncbi:MAG TPA: dienelactone hydrolase family protein [Thermodesulfobacteriota bacterium]|nr:dienelactone hydrolase family protein [Thermodesulfobacteriota bacterium]